MRIQADGTRILTPEEQMVSEEECKLQERIEKLEKHNTELLVLINAERERQEKCDDIHLPEAKQVSARKIEGSLTCDFEAGALYTVKMKTGKPHNVVIFPWQ